MAKLALVTGGTGYIGSHLIPALLGRGWQVRTCGRRERPADLQPEVDYIQADLTGEEQLPPLLEDVSHLFHLAGASSSLSSQEEMDESNVVVTDRLLAAAHRVGLQHIVYLSSSSVYGEEVQLPLPVTESVEPQPSRGYGKSKWLAERVVAQWVQRGAPVVTFRPVTVYGPRNIKLLASAILDIAIERYAGRRAIDVYQQPIDMRLLHISDLIEALLYHIDRPASAGQVYNITSGLYPTSHEIARIIADKLGISMAPRETPECGMSYEQREETRARMIRERGMKTDILFTKQRFRFLNKANRNNELSIQKLVDSGFTPRMTDTRQGISEVIDWYLENGWIV